MNPKHPPSTSRGCRSRAASAAKQQCNAKLKMKRFQWSTETMNAAVQAVASGSLSQRKASEQFGVPRATLQKLLNGKTHIGPNQGKDQYLGLTLKQN